MPENPSEPADLPDPKDLKLLGLPTDFHWRIVEQHSETAGTEPAGASLQWKRSRHRDFRLQEHEKRSINSLHLESSKLDPRLRGKGWLGPWPGQGKGKGGDGKGKGKAKGQGKLELRWS